MNLNDSIFEEKSISIFNGGVAGKVENVEITDVVKKTSSDKQNAPDFKVFYKDENGDEVNQGFYYFSPRPGADAKTVENVRNSEIARVLSFVKSVVGADYTFPEVKDEKDALNKLMKIIKDNVDGKKFNVYATYGTVNNPSAYIGIRKYSFIEPADTPVNESKLKPSNSDQLERLVPDQPDASNDLDSEDDEWTV